MDVDKVVEKLVVDYGIERRITNVGKEKLKKAYMSLLEAMDKQEAFKLLLEFADAFTSEEKVLNLKNLNSREGYNQPPANIKLPKTPPPAPPAPPSDYEGAYYEADKIGNNPAPAGRKPAPPRAPPPAPPVQLIAESQTKV